MNVSLEPARARKKPGTRTHDHHHNVEPPQASTAMKKLTKTPVDKNQQCLGLGLPLTAPPHYEHQPELTQTFQICSEQRSPQPIQQQSSQPAPQPVILNPDGPQRTKQSPQCFCSLAHDCVVVLDPEAETDFICCREPSCAKQIACVCVDKGCDDMCAPCARISAAKATTAPVNTDNTASITNIVASDLAATSTSALNGTQRADDKYDGTILPGPTMASPAHHYSSDSSSDDDLSISSHSSLSSGGTTRSKGIREFESAAALDRYFQNVVSITSGDIRSLRFFEETHEESTHFYARKWYHLLGSEYPQYEQQPEQQLKQQLHHPQEQQREHRSELQLEQPLEQQLDQQDAHEVARLQPFTSFEELNQYMHKLCGQRGSTTTGWHPQRAQVADIERIKKFITSYPDDAVLADNWLRLLNAEVADPVADADPSSVPAYPTTNGIKCTINRNTKSDEIIDCLSSGDEYDHSDSIADTEGPPIIRWNCNMNNHNNSVSGYLGNINYERRQFAMSNASACNIKRYWDVQPAREKKYMFKLYNWLCVGAVTKYNTPILSRCVLWHPENGHRFICMRVLMSLCNKPISGYYIYDTSRMDSIQDDGFELIKGK